MMESLFPPAAPFGVFAEGLAVSAAVMTAAWALSLWRRDASVVDGFWGATIAGLGWYYVWRTSPEGGAAWIVLFLATAWGGRLSAYLTWRNWGEPEDFRYRKMREKHGSRFPAVSLATVFLLQAVLAWVVSAPLFQSAVAPGGIGPAGWVGVVAALLGLGWEVVADWQLQRFRARREDGDGVLSDGLWRYSRHPNYFGEFVFWWGIFLATASTDGFLWGVASPLLMSVLLLRISGVPMLEERLEGRPEYRRYAERTNAFFPGPPRGDGGS